MCPKWPELLVVPTNLYLPFSGSSLLPIGAPSLAQSPDNGQNTTYSSFTEAREGAINMTPLP
jgi:hypothetical protein